MLSYHARTLVCIKVCLITLCIGHMILSICILALVSRVVTVVPACVAIIKVVILFQHVGVRWAASTSSAVSSASAASPATSSMVILIVTVPAACVVSSSSSKVPAAVLLLGLEAWWLGDEVLVGLEWRAMVASCAAASFACSLVRLVRLLEGLLASVLLWRLDVDGRRDLHCMLSRRICCHFWGIVRSLWRSVCHLPSEFELRQPIL